MSKKQGNKEKTKLYMYVIKGIAVCANKMAQQVKALATNPNDLSPTAHNRWKTTTARCPLTSIYVLWHGYPHPYTYINVKEIIIINWKCGGKKIYPSFKFYSLVKLTKWNINLKFSKHIAFLSSNSMYLRNMFSIVFGIICIAQWYNH